jgi:tellurite resistance protein TerC
MPARRIVHTVVGFLLLGAGAAMVLLPGPGWLTIALGLGILAREYEWARRWLDQLKSGARDLKSRVTKKSRPNGERRQ